jgi:hypothetical protein
MILIQKYPALQYALFAALLLLAATFAHGQGTPMTGSGSVTGFGEFDSGPGLIPSTLFGLHYSQTRGKFGSANAKAYVFGPPASGSASLSMIYSNADGGVVSLPWSGDSNPSAGGWETSSGSASAGYSFTNFDAAINAQLSYGAAFVVVVLQPISFSGGVGHGNTFTPSYVFTSGYASGLAGSPPQLYTCAASDYPGAGTITSGTCAQGVDNTAFPVAFSQPFKTAWLAAVNAALAHMKAASYAAKIAYVRVGGGAGGEWFPWATAALETQVSPTTLSGLYTAWLAYLNAIESDIVAQSSGFLFDQAVDGGFATEAVPYSWADGEAAAAVTNSFGVGDEGLKGADIAAFTTNGTSSGGSNTSGYPSMDSAYIFNLGGAAFYQFQTSAASDPTGIASPGSLVPLLPYAIARGANSLELYYQDWQVAFDSTNANYGTYGVAYRSAIQAARGYSGVPWPNVTFGSLRLWDANTNWFLMNPAAGVYNFSSLDNYLAAAKTNSLSDVLLTLSGTPAFISGDPTNASCDYGQNSGLVLYGLNPDYVNGSCGAPTDVNSDGTGTDATWKAFVYNLGTHIQGLNPSTYATVNWFELWNEFTRGPVSGGCGGSSSPISWEGTCAQLVRLAQDANCILTGAGPITATSQACTPSNLGVAAVGVLPTAGVLTPDAVPQLPDVTYFGTYLSTPGALNAVSGIAAHAYAYSGLGTTMPDSSANFSNTGSSLPSQWNMLQAVLPSAAFGIPVWSTEGSWSTGADLPDPDMQMGYIARYYLVGWSSGFRRLYWYSDNNSWGRLLWQDGENETAPTTPYASASACATSAGCSVLNWAGKPVANAWTSVYTWMVGNEMTSGCQPDATGNIWSCGLLVGGTTPALAIWDSSQICESAIITFVPASGGISKAVATSGGVWTFTAGQSVLFAGTSLASNNAGPFTVTGISTTTTTNDTLLLSDGGGAVTSQSSITGEAQSVSSYTYNAALYGHYEKLDDTPTLHSLSGGAVNLGWKPILLVP